MWRFLARVLKSREVTSLVWIAFFSSLLMISIFVYWASFRPFPLILVIVLTAIFPLIGTAYNNFLFPSTRKDTTIKDKDFAILAENHYVSPRVAKESAAESPGGTRSSDRKAAVVTELKQTYQEEYASGTFAMFVIPLVIVSLIGWTLLLQPMDVTQERTSFAESYELSHPQKRELRNTGNVEEQSTEPSTTPNANQDGADGQDAREPGSATRINTTPTGFASLPYLPSHVAWAMGLGFLGAILFCFQVLWRRITTLDLKPTIFLRCASALFTGMLLNLVLFSGLDGFSGTLFGTPGSDTTAKFISYFVAFALGYFPMLGIRWMTRLTNNALGEPARRADSQRLMLVDGISVFHEERLLEEGMQNQHDMAYADLGMLLIKTPYTAAQLLDWSGQCQLLLYLTSTEADIFRSCGIRRAKDILQAWPPATSSESGEVPASINELRKHFAGMLHADPQRLDAIRACIEEDLKATQQID